MNFERSDKKTLRAFGIAPALHEVIASIPAVANGRREKNAKGRIFTRPGADAALDEDWKTLVEPELAHLFESSTETVAKDLSTLARSEDEEGLELRIPLAHVDAWLNCLNQARLVLASRIGYTEEDHMREFTGPPKNAREMVIFQIELYALMQEWLIHVAEQKDFGSGEEDADERE